MNKNMKESINVRKNVFKDIIKYKHFLEIWIVRGITPINLYETFLLC